MVNALPPDTGLAFVLVQHVTRTYRSQLPMVLSAGSAIPVIEAFDGQAVEPNHVYVSPASPTTSPTRSAACAFLSTPWHG
ncbi:MAG TPA: chemotaxis protein CheB [Planctomycetota bacterium]|nr:chemotaxis protein CheB [Planctomycetota bacterium]